MIKWTNKKLYRMHANNGYTYAEIARITGLTRSAVAGRIWRYKELFNQNRELFSDSQRPKSEPLLLHGNEYMIVGDVHVAQLDYHFAGLPLAIARKHMQKPRNLIIAGDFLTAEQSPRCKLQHAAI